MENLSNYLRPSKKKNPWSVIENGVYAVSAAGIHRVRFVRDLI